MPVTGASIRHPYNPPMRLRSLLSIAALTATAAAAQTPARPDAAQAGEPRGRNQKIERIRIEDGGNRIDEVRVGGETQSVTVQPKGEMPAYEIQPTDLSRSRPSDSRDGDPVGKRVWNVLKF